MRCNRVVLASGFSRGAKWLLQVACRHAHLIDVALVLAGYPTNKEYSIQIAEAQAISNAPVPVDIIQYQEDAFCSPALYPHWTKKLLALAGDGINTRYKVLRGGHDDAQDAFSNTTLEIYARLWNSTSAERRGLVS